MCKFCSELNKCRYIFSNSEDDKYKFKSALYIERYTIGVPTSQTISKPHDLKYCPECGKKIGGGK